MLLPLFLTPTTAISTEVEDDFQASDLTELSQLGLNKLLVYDYLPKNPILSHATAIYKDDKLTEVANYISQETSLQIVALTLNQEGVPVFELKTGEFLPANRELIAEDIVLEEEFVDITSWTLEGLTTYDKPYVKGVGQSKNPLSPLTRVTLTQRARTRSGNYYKVEGNGWVSEDFLTTENLNMKKVQQLLDSKYRKDNLSVYVKSLTTDEVAEINADKKVYTASVTKLPILYYAQEKLNAKKVTLDQPLKYTKESLLFDGAYDTEGSGSMSKIPDDKEYSVEHILKAIAQESDNVASDIAGYYLADKFDKAFTEEITSIVGEPWDMVSREATVRMAGRMMEAIYEQNGQIVDYLSHTNFDQERIAKDIPVPVAHKIGDAYDFRHDVAIIYGKTPFVLAIFTENMTYEDITAIANDIYDILK